MSAGTQAALSEFAAMVDPKVGIIRAVEVIKISETDPCVYLAHADPCDSMPLAGIAAANRGAACAIDAGRAILRACGECVERYCSAFFEFDRMLLASPRELSDSGDRLVPPGALYPFQNRQYAGKGFPYAPVTSECRIRWVPGQSARSGRVWLPASCVYVPYLFETGVEPFTHMPISTGLAAGESMQACIEKGIAEIVERDALMIVWYGRIPAPRIRPLSCFGISSDIDGLLASVRGAHTHWLLNVLTLDVDIPVIGACLIDDGSPPLTSFGIAAHVDPARALLGALEEALMTRLLVNRCSELQDGTAFGGGALRTLRDHLLAHAASPELLSRMTFLTQEGPIVDFQDVTSGRSESVAERCAAAGLEPVWVDVTTPDVEEFGFKVVRTVIAGMQPLDNDHRNRHLGGERLLSVPRKMGFSLSPGELNPDPHPFP